jgi:hypothetical protein
VRAKRSPAEGPLSAGYGSGGGRGWVDPAFDGPSKAILPHPGSLSVRFATLEINLPPRRELPNIHSPPLLRGRPPLVSKPDEELCVNAVA